MGAASSLLFFLQIDCLQPVLSLEKHTLSHTHTLGLETVNNHPTDFETRCCSPRLSANMRLLALRLAPVKV